MPKFHTLLAATGLLLFAGAVSSTLLAPKPKLRFTGWQEGDSISFLGQWTRVPDARGRVDSVSYRFVMYQGLPRAAAVDSLISRDTVFHATRAFPPPGDTAYYSGCVQAIDMRRVSSGLVCSDYVMVVGVWFPPPPPILKFDTLTVPDSLHIYSMGSRVDGPFGPEYMTVGLSRQLCAVLWYSQMPFLPANQVEECYPLIGQIRNPGVWYEA